MPHNSDPNVNLKVGIPKSLDRSIEADVFKLDVTKKSFVQVALRAFMELPKQERERIVRASMKSEAAA